MIVLTCATVTTGAFVHDPSTGVRTAFLLVLASLFALPAFSALPFFDSVADPDSAGHSSKSYSTLSESIEKVAVASVGRERLMSVGVAAVDVTTRDMLRDPKCWLLLFSTFCTIGGGEMVTTNSAQMMQAVGAGEGAASVAVTLFAATQVIKRG